MTSSHAEQLRRAALRAYAVLDSAPAPDLDGVVTLASMITGAPVALVNLADDDRLWHAAVHGGERGEIPREGAMCSWVVDNQARLYVRDAQQDAAWADSPFVDGRLAAVRMYAGAPLVDSTGATLGTLCVLDPQPRTLTLEQLGALSILADQVVELLAGRRRALALAAAVEELDRLAHIDALTGLLNRTAATRALDRVCETGGWGLLFVDVDGFKAVNDQSGHEAGDVVLREIAVRLREGLRPHDLLARWSGDEFLVLLSGPVAADDIVQVTRRLRASVARPYALEGWALELSVSIGGLVVPAGSAAGDVLRRADRSMYDAKRSMPPRLPRQPRSGPPDS